MSSKYKYQAFISYSHKDEKWASWLHKALETFKIPKYLVGESTSVGIVPQRIGKVFRDREELSSSHSLGTELTQAFGRLGSHCNATVLRQIQVLLNFGLQGALFV